MALGAVLQDQADDAQDDGCDTDDDADDGDQGQQDGDDADDECGDADAVGALCLRHGLCRGHRCGGLLVTQVGSLFYWCEL